MAPEEAEHQLELFQRPPRYAKLVRPCTVEDGIEAIKEDSVSRLYELHSAAAEAGRFVKFVPASGAASRMFRELLYFQRGEGRDTTWQAVRSLEHDGAGEAAALVEFIDKLGRFAFYDDLVGVLRERGQGEAVLAPTRSLRQILDALLDAAGLGYAELPKGLLKFHAYDTGSRTPFEEHLIEAASYARDREGTSRLHFTVSPEHRERFLARFKTIEADYGAAYDTRFEIGYSEQKPSTDTIAVDLENRPLRDDAGRLRFRPGGHGALIENLNDLGGDLVYVKNIDNVQPDHRKRATLEWKRLLGGLLVQLQGNVFESIQRIRETGLEAEQEESVKRISSVLHVGLNGDLPPSKADSRRDHLIERLDRPLRVCGVVPNTGEPGGGPFWVRGTDGVVSTQIVESAQVDPHDEEQQRIFRSSTHFNPVDLVCAVRNLEGKSYDLHRFIDRDAVIVTRKSAEGRDLKAQERPGLWNGAMAGWNTVFVEVPIETFSPVKSVLDLLRPEHQ